MGRTVTKHSKARPRKVDDADIIRLNSVGLSLTTSAEILGVHPSTVTMRLRELGVAPADTRRTFMEDIFVALPNPIQEWLADQLGPHISIKDYVKGLIVRAYYESRKL